MYFMWRCYGNLYQAREEDVASPGGDGNEDAVEEHVEGSIINSSTTAIACG